MKRPDLIPIYAHLLCNEELSEMTEDASQHLFQQAVDAGLLQPDAGDEGPGLCSEPTMMRLLEISAAAVDVELRRSVNRLEVLLLKEFPTKIMHQQAWRAGASGPESRDAPAAGYHLSGAHH